MFILFPADAADELYDDVCSAGEFWLDPPSERSVSEARHAFDEFCERCNGQLPYEQKHACRQLLDLYEDEFWSLNFMSADGAAIDRYFDAASAFVQMVRHLENIDVDPFCVQTYEEAVLLHRSWVDAEREIAALGYRTVPYAAWFDSCSDPGYSPRIPRPVLHLLAVKRERDEQPVFHAVKFLEKRMTKEKNA